MLDTNLCIRVLRDRLAGLRMWFDAEAAGHAAEIKTVLERQGRAIGSYDLLIAGHSRRLVVVVVTGNLGEFSRVAGLRCEDWLINGDLGPWPERLRSRCRAARARIGRHFPPGLALSA